NRAWCWFAVYRSAIASRLPMSSCRFSLQPDAIAVRTRRTRHACRSMPHRHPERRLRRGSRVECCGSFRLILLGLVTPQQQGVRAAKLVTESLERAQRLAQFKQGRANLAQTLVAETGDRRLVLIEHAVGRSGD